MDENDVIRAGKAAVTDAGSSFQSLHLRPASCCSKPSWLLSTITGLDLRIRSLTLNSHDSKDEDQVDTFAQRAEFYYQQRPQRLSLLQELYDTYLSLAERYCQCLHKNHSHVSSDQISCSSSVHHSHNSYHEDYQSDAESSLSYQLPPPTTTTINLQYNSNISDHCIADLVIKNVEYELLVHELGLREKAANESSRKIELQRSLLEVLESERLILLNENAGLRYKVGALIEENKGLASESMFMKRKAGELARYLLKMRDDHRVCVLSRKIEDLQGKIYGLEKRNQEYYQQLVKKERSPCPSCKGDSSGEVKFKDDQGIRAEACFQREWDKKDVGIGKRGGRFSKWWDKVKSSDVLLLCKLHPSKSLG